jgi:hypothetical protein
MPANHFPPAQTPPGAEWIDGPEVSDLDNRVAEDIPPADISQWSRQLDALQRQVQSPRGDAPWEVETDQGWLPWSPTVDFVGRPGERIQYRQNSFEYHAIFTSDSEGTQTNVATGKQRRVRRVQVIKPWEMRGVWEVETDQGWTEWSPGVPVRGMPGEEIGYTLGRFPYTATFSVGGVGIQKNTQTGKQRNLRFRPESTVPSGPQSAAAGRRQSEV